MVWSNPNEGAVSWFIPADRLADAVECIAYWYKRPVRVESAPTLEPILVKTQTGGVRIDGWMV